MNPILLSFLCGAAFLGGATAVVVMVAMAVQLKDKAGRLEICEHWKQSLLKHDKQLLLLERIATTIEKNSNET